MEVIYILFENLKCYAVLNWKLCDELCAAPTILDNLTESYFSLTQLQDLQS